MITLFKGDDTGGLLGKSVVVEISTEFDLTGCTVIFNYQGIERRWENVHDGDRREVFFSHNETARMSVGTFKAVIIAVDAAGKVRTITNSLPIKVSTNLAECYGDNVAQVTIGTTVNWERITGKPFEGQEIDIGTDDKVLEALGTIIEKLGGTVKAGIALGALCAMSAFGYTPEAHTNSYERDGVTYAQRGGLGASDYVVTNIDASSVGKVQSVNGKTGEVQLNASDLEALPLVEDASGDKTAVTIGTRKSDGPIGKFSLANGSSVGAFGICSHAEGEYTTASGPYSHAEGQTSTAFGPYSHAEGGSTKASGTFSHVEGHSTQASGSYSHAEGNETSASGGYSHAEGHQTRAEGIASHAEGFRTAALADYSHASGTMSETKSGHDYAFVWNGDQEIDDPYISHGLGTFNINPYGGLGGFFIGDRSLQDIFDGRYLRADSQGGPPGYIYIDTNVYFSTARTGNLFVESFDNIRQYDEHGEPLEDWVKYIVRTLFDANDSDFSNAVLAVGLNIDTNSVAVLNDIAATFGGFPIEGTATTVGGLLAALAAAVAWLKKNKVQTLKLENGSVETSADGGVAKLDDFFTGSNSLLTATVDARLPYPLYAVPSTGLLKDRAINTTSLASVTVPDNFTDLLIRASVASSLAVTMPEAIATKYGDTFPGEAGEYLITITKTGAAEAYVRTIKLEEVANA